MAKSKIPKQPRDPRDPRNPRNPRNPRESREPREYRVPGESREPRDSRKPREPGASESYILLEPFHSFSSKSSRNNRLSNKTCDSGSQHITGP